jgi:Flp pilus assembly pilin Flp
MRARPLARLLSRFRRSERGLAAVEFALIAPFLSLLLLGGYDVSRYVLIHGQVEKVGFSVSDVTAQYDNEPGSNKLNSAALRQVFLITGQTLPSYKSGVNGVTIITSVYLSNTTPKVSWQCYSTAGTTWKSKVGSPGGNATVPSGLLADASDRLIVSEVYYKYKPVFGFVFKNGFDIYTKSMYRPRLGTADTMTCP